MMLQRMALPLLMNRRPASALGSYRAAFDLAPIGMAYFPVDGMGIEANRSLRDMIGYRSDELRNTTYQSLTHPEDREVIGRSIEALLGGRRDVSPQEHRILHKSGKTVYTRATVSLARKHPRTEPHLFAVVEDLTERRTIAEVLCAREQALASAHMEIGERLAQAAEFRDDDTGSHTRRVGLLSARLAVDLGWPALSVDLMRRAAPLHDVGKIAIPDAILLKPGKLSARQRRIMETHTTLGAKLLSGGDSPLMHMAEEIAQNHHERWDGTGYPNGLRGTEIPTSARIVAVADFFDALTHSRPYRPAWGLFEALREVSASAGTHFDPEIAECLLRLGPPKLSTFI